MKQVITKVPLKVSRAGFTTVVPLTMQQYTYLLSRLDGEVQKPHVFLRSPNMRENNLNFEIQPTR